MEARKSNKSLDSKPEKKPFVVDCVSANSKLPQYDGLRDANLRAYFSSKRKRKLLMKVGLVTATQVNTKGEILTDGSRSGRSRDRSAIKKNASGIFHSPESSRSVYLTSERSHSVKVSKTTKKLSLKPVTHQELQDLFAKYKPAEVVAEVPSQAKFPTP